MYDATRHVYRFNQLYAVEERYERLVDEIVVPNNLMQYRWGQLAKRIANDFAGEDVQTIVLMSGGKRFY